MLPWRHLNIKGKILAVCVFINMYFSVLYVTTGSFIAIFPACMAMICGISTYNPRYQQLDATDINNRE
jgi:hypothetical protein